MKLPKQCFYQFHFFPIKCIPLNSQLSQGVSIISTNSDVQINAASKWLSRHSIYIMNVIYKGMKEIKETNFKKKQNI